MIRSALFLGATGDPRVLRASELLQRHIPNTTAYFADWARAKSGLPDTARWWSGGLLVSYRSRWIVPDWLLAKATDGAINIHPGPPEYPGIGSTNFALYEGAESFGATLHHMDASVDTGRIIAVKRFRIRASESLESLTDRTYAACDALFLDAFLRLTSDQPLPESHETWTGPRRTRRELNALTACAPDMAAEEIERRFRATYMPGLPDAFVANVKGLRADRWLEAQAITHSEP